ncbi:MAG: hypothetical protein JWN84_2964, partial [Nocardioides sp.]|nr:hypothetical protein [Nocardioides sp.]
PLAVALLATAVGLAAAGPLASLLGLGDHGRTLLLVVLVALPCAVATDLLLAGTRGVGRVGATVVVDRLGRTGLQPVLVLAVLLTGGGLVAAGAAWAAVHALAAVAAWVVLRRTVLARIPSPATPASPGLGRAFCSFTAPRGVAGFAQAVMQKADIVLVAALLGATQAAVYAVATRFVVAAQAVNLAITQVLQPRFTAILVADDPATLRAVFSAGTTGAVLLAWPVLLVVACLPQAYLGVFGSAYVTGEGVVVVVTLAVAMMLSVACGPVDTLLLMSGRSRTSMAITLLAAAIDVVLCLVLVPRHGIAAAAAAWAVAIVVRATLTARQVRRDLGPAAGVDARWLVAAVPTLCFAVPLLAAHALGAQSSALAVAAAVSVAVASYAVALVLLRRRLGLDLLLGALRPGALPRRVTRAARRVLPARAESTARSLTHLWGRATVRARMTPEVLVVGAQRSGTTTLFRLLAEHPALVRPTLSKGTGYFDDHYDRGRAWYLAHFPLRRPGGRQRAFEVSGYYLCHPLAAQRIARDLPGVQVVVLVRDPVERARSAHGHELARGFETLGLAEALALEPVRTAGELDRLARDPGHRSHAHRHHAYLQRGEYAAQIRRYVDALGRDRVHVVDADRFFADPVGEYVRLQQDLGLPVVVPDAVEAVNARTPRPVPDELRRRLLRHYEPHDAELTELLGAPPSWRQRPDRRDLHRTTDHTDEIDTVRTRPARVPATVGAPEGRP